jgi:hypothetical protein
MSEENNQIILTKEEQIELLKFVKFFKSYNPEYRMADGMKANFIEARKKVEKIYDRFYGI